MNIGLTRPMPIIGQATSNPPAGRERHADDGTAADQSEPRAASQAPRSNTPRDAAQAAEIILSSLHGAWNRQPQNRAKGVTDTEIVTPPYQV